MTPLEPRILEAPTTWDLDTLFPGGVTGGAFTRLEAEVSEQIVGLEGQIAALPAVADDIDATARVITELWATRARIGAILSMSSCARAERASDRDARRARQRAERAYARLQEVEVPLWANVDEADDATFEALVSLPALEAERPSLRNDRRRRHLRLPRAERALEAALLPHASGGWGALYSDIAGGLTATVQLPGEDAPSTLSMGQLSGMLSATDEAVREIAHRATLDAWSTVAPTCARALEHITGTRAALNRRRGVDELADTCARNRIERATLDAMWEGVEAVRPRLQPYLARKARLLGKERLDWWDLYAPLQSGDGPSVTWGEACTDIVEAFSGFDEGMGRFAAQALNRRWVEAESRGDKRAGGFCTRAGHLDQSRVFLTWSDSLRSAMTLAHELGHAWHNERLFTQDASRRSIVSATAESASTLGEALYRDHLVAHADDASLRVRVLDQLCMAGMTMLMNIRARYTFERALYRLEAAGPLDVGELSQTMLDAQHDAYGAETLASWNPLFWSSKLHFFIASFGFYNWPYTFGYLFSSAIYDRARAEGPRFAPEVRRLLGETGYRWTEDVAQDVLGADLTDPAFWTEASQPLLDAIDAFLDETKV